MNVGFFNTPASVFANPAAQLAPFNPYLSLAATNPFAALSAVSPTLNIFNPAINPNAALLAFNPAAAPTLALGSKTGKATKAAALPFYGKYGKI